MDTEARISTEEAVIGAILVNNDSINKVRGGLLPEYFSKEQNSVIYSAMLELSDNGKAITLITLKDILIRKGDLEKAGGVAFLGDLAEKATTSAGIENHADMIIDEWRKDKLLALHNRLTEDFKFNKTSGEMLDSIMKGYINLYIEKRIEDKEIIVTSDRMPDFQLELKKSQQQDKDFIGFDTGFTHLNRVINGLCPELFIYAGMPGAGKTTLLKQLVDNVAMINSVPCILFSYEQSIKEMDIKTLARLAKVDSRKIARGLLDRDPEAWGKVNDAFSQYDRFGRMLYIIEATAKVTIDDIRIISKGIFARHRATRGLIAIDYLQVIPARENERFNSTKDKISTLTSGLKRISRELDSPIVAISSEARDKYNKKNISVFKESGEIEYSADILGVLTGKENSKGEHGEREVELHIVKNRNGERATISFNFFPQFSNFDEKGSKDYIEETEDSK